MPEPRTAGRQGTTLAVMLTPAQRATLEAWLRRRDLPYGVHKRARAVLLVAEGLPITEVARRVDLGRHHVDKWVVRFQMYGCDGLLDTPRHSPTQGRWAARRREDAQC